MISITAEHAASTATVRINTTRFMGDNGFHIGSLDIICTHGHIGELNLSSGLIITAPIFLVF